jgi:hypothetical protein
MRDGEPPELRLLKPPLGGDGASIEEKEVERFHAARHDGIGVSSSLATSDAMAQRGTRNPTASHSFLEMPPLGRAACRNPQSVPDKDLQIAYEVSNVTCHISRVSCTVGVNTPDDPETLLLKIGAPALWRS